jgi:7-cyano-7-deazaguanine synthase in queuosine biosynthesis
MIDLPDNAQRIAVLYSGGVDSSTMLYAIAAKYPDRHIVAITAGCSYINNRVHLPFAAKMLDVMINSLPAGAINEHIITYHDDRIGHHCGQYMHQNRDIFDVWVVGQNAAPSEGSIAVDKNGAVHDLFTSCPLESRKIIADTIWSTWEGHTVYKPLLHLDKQAVFDIATQHGIYDAVANYSRSCPKVYTDDNIDKFVAHCGTCWWCLERKWGMRMQDDIAEIYNELSINYEQKYVNGDDNHFLCDEELAAWHWHNAGFVGDIVSLGVGSGQDIEIMGRPDPALFRGFDISAGMLANAKIKFPDYHFFLHDCNMQLTKEQGDADVLVAMFGAANYLGVNKLIEQYKRLNCNSAFFIFYHEDYVDGVVTDYNVYSSEKLKRKFADYNAVVEPLEKGSNYYVVRWNNSRSL